MAAGEICLTNRSNTGIVADIAVEKGSRSVTFLTVGEQGCSQSPGATYKGKIIVSLKENQPPYCEIEAVTGTQVTLMVFSAPDNCEWS